MPQKKDNVNSLTQLGSAKTRYQYQDPDPTILETFPNQYPERPYITTFAFKEFTSLCPKTGQPDFAVITIRYVPQIKCIETKSLKLYLLSFRQHGSFMETIVNQILDDCVTACTPKWMIVTGKFNTRGGTDILVEAAYTLKE